jgi:hypothetical protein
VKVLELIRTINAESILGNGNVQIITVYETIKHGDNDTGTDNTPYILTYNVFYKWDAVSSLTLTLGAEKPGITNSWTVENI